jgi:hypothetical protein
MRQLAKKRTDGQDAAASKAFGGLRTLTGELHALIRRYREQIACEERLLFALAEMRLTAEQDGESAGACCKCEVAHERQRAGADEDRDSLP